MSETYTVGGDTWQPLIGFDISGQTFTPTQSHTIYYVDLNLRLFSTVPPQIAISACDASHTPVGPILSYGNYTGILIYLPGAILRVRFALETPLNLIEGSIYSIWVYKALADPGPINHVLYDKDDATYPRGHIIFSDDGGNTWTHFNNSDFIFTEFGNPPLPKPLPSPPIPNFAPIDITYRHFTNATLIRLSTSVPCHLTCYSTDKTPLKHHTSRIVRGLEVPWATYFCFVAWQPVEQIEQGDTLYHTFGITPWAPERRRWFTFRGDVDNVQSPSVGPIFDHKHPGQDIILNPFFLYWNPAGDEPIDWQVLTLPGDPSWFSADHTYRLYGYYSALCSIPLNFKLQRLISSPDPAYLSNLKIRFEIGYRGYLTDFNRFTIEARGDVTRIGTNTPTKHYEWERRSVTLTMPDNLYQLKLTCFNNNQNFPIPYQNWWDDVNLYLE